MGLIIGWTGHRPDEFTDHEASLVMRKIDELLTEYKPEKVIVGGAQGVDTWVASLAAQQGIPFLLAIPFEGQHLIWPEGAQKVYGAMRNAAAEVVIVCEGGWNSKKDNYKFQKRNEYIVDHCDLLIGIWNGSDGGTSNCLRYGIKKDKAMRVIDPRELSADPV